MSAPIKIKVIGIGGSGGNAISRMKSAKINGVELIAINTDSQDLKTTKTDIKIQIGRELTLGFGAGMNPEIGRKAALENKEDILKILENTDMVFITYGAGGGTGTGGGPIVAELAKSLGILTVAVVTRPFSFEGQARQNIADTGIKKLKENVDSLIIISNDKLLSILDPNTPLTEAFWICDDTLRQAVCGISDLIVLPGIINVNFADIKEIIKNSGTALFGVGRAEGEKRAETAALLAVNSPLLDVSCKGAKGVLFNISGDDISLSEIDEAAKVITKEINPDAKIIFGAIQNEKLKKGQIKVTVIATGF
ncbi:MAG: cell division protein FtsZ [Patescibacteria group bacterium]|nr:cell division protein FtsZ [Patescibacteria group bacterium]MBU1877108.1 cell division protein FtsZ [Patescibacteria group bacterium]